jgi:hypothetical protein
MNKISAREIRVFVAGVLAFWGFRALVSLPSYLFLPAHEIGWWIGRVFGEFLTALALPLGIAIFAGKTRGFLLAKIYLWYDLTASFIVIPCFYIPLGSKAVSLIGSLAPDMIVCIVLLWLLCSQRFQEKSDGRPAN